MTDFVFGLGGTSDMSKLPQLICYPGICMCTCICICICICIWCQWHKWYVKVAPVPPLHRRASECHPQQKVQPYTSKPNSTTWYHVQANYLPCPSKPNNTMPRKFSEQNHATKFSKIMNQMGVWGPGVGVGLGHIVNVSSDTKVFQTKLSVSTTIQ